MVRTGMKQAWLMIRTCCEPMFTSIGSDAGNATVQPTAAGRFKHGSAVGSVLALLMGAWLVRRVSVSFFPRLQFLFTM